MMQVREVMLFLALVASRGLGWRMSDHQTSDLCGFLLDTDNFRVYAHPNAKSVLAIIDLAAEMTPDHRGTYGDHVALLALVARREELALGKSVTWFSKHSLVYVNDADVISMREWLIEQGEDPYSVFSAEALEFLSSQ